MEHCTRYESLNCEAVDSVSLNRHVLLLFSPTLDFASFSLFLLSAALCFGFFFTALLHLCFALAPFLCRPLPRFLLSTALGFGFSALAFDLSLPLRFGFLPATLLLCTLAGLNLLVPTFFRRQPWLPQRIDYLAAKVLDSFAHGGRLNVVMPKLPPIDVLTLRDDRKHWVVSPLRLIGQRRNRDVQDREK
jgi:hypothetical protein